MITCYLCVYLFMFPYDFKEPMSYSCGKNEERSKRLKGWFTQIQIQTQIHPNTSSNISF